MDEKNGMTANEKKEQDTIQLSKIDKVSDTLKLQQEIQKLRDELNLLKNNVSILQVRDELNLLKNNVSILQSQKRSAQPHQSPNTAQSNLTNLSTSDINNKNNNNIPSSAHTSYSSIGSNVQVIDSKRKDRESRASASWWGGSCGRGCCTVRYGLNPIVFIISTLIIWGFTIWCLFDPNAYEILLNVQTFIIRTFSWLYVGSLCSFTILMIYLACHPQYSQIKLGKENEKPKYNMISWFSMLFSAGYGIGLYFYGVAESVLHFRDSYEGCNRYSYLPTQLQAVAGLNLSWFHGGFAALCVYCLVGLTVGYLAHKHDMPMTMRTCFYPLLGDKIYGIIGDIIDISAVVATMFGLTTSLGLGTLQLNAGMTLVFGEDIIPNNTLVQIIIIWIITGFATISVLSGVDKGIKIISELNFFFGCSLLIYLFWAGDTFFLLNLFVETLGFHVNNLPIIFTDTDSFEQVGFDNDSNPQTWMGTWTVFYWSWWIAWSPFVGIFIAEISRGRTVRQFIIGNMAIPTIVTCVWTTIMGGLGLLLEFHALELGLGDDCYDHETCYKEIGEDPITDGTYTRLSCLEAQNQLFVLIDYYPLSKFVSIITIIGVTGYFVTSSDSASYVIDLITTNGEENGPKLQRTFWACTEGAVASVVLIAGGSDALYALQTVSIASALPFCFILLLMIYSLLTLFRNETEMKLMNNSEQYIMNQPINSKQQLFIEKKTNTTDTIHEEKEHHESNDETDSDGNNNNNNNNNGSNNEIDNLSEEWNVNFFDALCDNCKMCILSFICPCYLQFKNGLKVKLYDSCYYGWTLLYFVPPFAFIICLFCSIIDMGFFYVAWTLYVFIAFFGVYQRLKIRMYYKINGNPCCDVFAHLCCYCFAVSQESTQCDYEVLI